MAKNEIESIIKRFAIELKKEGIEIIKVFLYGSYARGNYREDSDIDVAVICKDFASDPIEQNMKLMRIAVHIDTRLSPISLSIADFKNEYIPLVPEIKKGLDLTAVTI
jgi:predicted nucleotidyltransferase